MKAIIGTIAALICVVGFTGCWRPYHEAMLVDVGTSEVAFLIETVNENGQVAISPKDKGGNTKEDGSEIDFFKNRMVSARRIEIPYIWKGTDYTWFVEDSTNGKWIPGARLITVDTQPETREWSKTKSNPIWVESSDSVGFSTGISVTARIEGKEDAMLFLSNYKPDPNNKRVVESGNETFEVEVTSLEQVMDEEVRTKIQEVFAYEAAAYTMDELREKKREILDAIKETVIPFFEERGITITTIGQFGGFEYENPKIQEAIDNVFAAQQDEEVAKAEAKAAEQRKVALQLEGEGEAAKILESKKGEAAGIQAVADAKAYEIEKANEDLQTYLELKRLEVEMRRLEEWDGKYPVYYFTTGSGDTPDLLITPPTGSK